MQLNKNDDNSQEFTVEHSGQKIKRVSEFLKEKMQVKIKKNVEQEESEK